MYWFPVRGRPDTGVLAVQARLLPDPGRTGTRTARRGQAVDIRGAAIDVARQAGILGALRQAHTRTRGMTYVSATGKHLASTNAAFGVVDAADVEIVRGNLVGILHEAARSGAEYIFGDSVTGMAEVPGAVEVTFERAKPRTFDLRDRRRRVALHAASAGFRAGTVRSSGTWACTCRSSPSPTTWDSITGS